MLSPPISLLHFIPRSYRYCSLEVEKRLMSAIGGRILYTRLLIRVARYSIILIALRCCRTTSHRLTLQAVTPFTRLVRATLPSQIRSFGFGGSWNG